MCNNGQLFFGSKPNVSSVKWSSCILLNALDAKWSSICKGKWRYTWLVRIHRVSHSQYSNNCSTSMNTRSRPGPKVADCTGLSFVFVCMSTNRNQLDTPKLAEMRTERKKRVLPPSGVFWQCLNINQWTPTQTHNTVSSNALTTDFCATVMQCHLTKGYSKQLCNSVPLN